MISLKRQLWAAVCLLSFVAPAGAGSFQSLPDTPKALQVSVVHVGEPLNCLVDECAKSAVAPEAPEPVKPSQPLIDAYGMPTNLPTVIRGGETSHEVVVSAPRKMKPAKESSPANTESAEAPAEGEESANPLNLE